MRLAEYIETRTEHILQEWEDFARTRHPAAQGMDIAGLRDHAEAILQSIAKDMAASQSNTEQQAKSQGLRPQNAPRMSEASRQHAGGRFADRFTIDQLISEFRALRASVLRLWKEEGHEFGGDAFDETTRFNEAIDQALTESIACYSKKLDDAREMFVCVLGHDLRGPLSTAAICAQQLLRTDTVDATGKQAATRIHSSVGRMAQMVDDLLDFAGTRLGGQLELDKRIGDLRFVVEQITEETRARYRGRMLTLSIEGDTRCVCDPDRVGQLVANLLINAFDHGDANATVEVKLDGCAPQRVSLSVHNDGPPISQEAQSRLFDPMLRTVVKSAERRIGSSGLGLGLYIANQVALTHGGTLECESREGSGTTFIATLPR